MIYNASMISIVIPAYNEAGRIGPTLSSIKRYIDSRSASPDFAGFEVFVVDDGSTDATARIVADFCAGDRRFSLMRMPANKGKGATIRAGMAVAGGDQVLFMDADGSIPIDELDRFYRLSGPKRAVIASRRMPDSRIAVRQPALRRWTSFAGGLFRRLFLLPHIRDSQCGFKLFSRPAVARILDESTISGYAFDIEALHILARAGFNIREVGVRWSHGEHGAFSLGTGSVEILKDLLRIRLRSLYPKGSMGR